MILRPATLADRAAVVDLALHFHAATPYAALLDVDPERVGATFDVALAHGVVLVAALEPGAAGDALVAFLALAAHVHMLSGERYAEEIAWWVEPAYRTGTLGPRLLARGEAWAAAHGCAFVTMAAPWGSDVARYYARCGYVPVETAFLKRVA